MARFVTRILSPVGVPLVAIYADSYGTIYTYDHVLGLWGKIERPS